MIQIDHLTFSIDGKTILNNITAEIGGGLTCIIGENGAGKTMLLKALAALIQPQYGNVFLNGQNIQTFTRKHRAQSISYLPQIRPVPQIDAQLLIEHGRFPYSGFSNKLTERDNDIVRSVMEQLNLLSIGNKKLTELSGGERQRVYIAAAMAQETDVLLLDEPTTYLDLQTQIELLKLLQSVAKSGRTVIAVMHDILQAMTFADKILVINNGTVFESGSPEDIAERNQLQTLIGYRLEKENNNKALYHFHLLV